MNRTQHLDTRPLTAPVPWRLARTYSREIDERLPKDQRPHLAQALWILSFMSVFVLFVFGSMAVRVFSDINDVDIGLLVLLIVPALIPVGCLGIVIWRIAGWVTLVRRRWRLRDFTAANGWQYDPWSGIIPPSGLLFGYSSERAVIDRIDDPDHTDVAFGRYREVQGSGRSRRVIMGDFAEIVLPIDLPHIILDARANDRPFGRSNLDAGLTANQRLDLEGDFPRHFRLYCPVGYEKDALYLFTPDVMAALIDHAADLDVEIVDNRMFLYSPNRIVTTDPARWEALMQTIAVLKDQTASWERWRDDRLQWSRAGSMANFKSHVGVASAGRRLKKKTEWFWIIFGILMIGFSLYSVIADFVTWVIGLMN